MFSVKSDRGFLTVLLVAYVVLAAVLAPLYLYYINNDGVAYLAIARTMAAGDWFNALDNTYWNPFFPFVVSFGLRMGLSALVTAKILTLGSGFVATLLIAHIGKLLPINRLAYRTMLFTAAGVSLYFGLMVITPDLMLATILLAYSVLMLDNSLREKGMWKLWIALIIFIGYMTKTVALPLMVTHFCVMQCLGFFVRKDIRFAIVRQTIIVLGITAVLVAPWLWWLHHISGSFMIGENARYIHAVLNPILGETMAIPMYVDGLIPPPHELAISMWDNPTKTAYAVWSVFDSWDHVIDQLKIIYLNADSFFRMVLLPFFLTWFLLCAALVLSFAAPQTQDMMLRRYARFFAALWVILLGFCLPLMIEERYFWGHILLSIPMGAALLSVLFERVTLNRMQRGVAASLFVASFAIFPAWQLLWNYRDGEGLHTTSIQLSQAHQFSGQRIAADNWKVGLRIAFHSSAQYYGLPKAGADAAVEQELLSHDIAYFLVTDRRERAFSSYVSKGTVDNITVYSRR